MYGLNHPSVATRAKMGKYNFFFKKPENCKNEAF